MPVAASALRLFIALVATAVITPVFASSQSDLIASKQKESWLYYSAKCQRLQRDMTDIQNGRTSDPREALYTLRNTLDTLGGYRLTLSQQHYNSTEFAQCENIIAQAEAMANQAQNDASADAERDKEQARITHQNSPEYKRARSLGYSDVERISYLKMLQDMYGEKAMKSLMIIVDPECGQYFKATQVVKPYVIYTASASSGGCGEEKRVAVLGAKSVERGDWIDPDGVFEYVGWTKIVGADGFATDIRVLKARRR